jgi:hypothetical protein
MVSPVNLSTDGGVSVEIKTFYKKGLIKFAEKATVFNQFGQSATISRNQGKTWEWRRPSQLTKITGAGGIAVYSTVFFGMDYFGKVDISGLTTDSIFHDVGSAGAADPLNQRWTQGWKTTFAAKILNEAYAVVVEHAVA